MMTREESAALAEAMLAKAGWFPHPEWGTYVRENLVFGIQPDRLGVHVKDFTKIPPGHPLYSADTPDEPHEAAAWLIAKFGKQEQAGAHETDSKAMPEGERPVELVARQTEGGIEISRADISLGGRGGEGHAESKGAADDEINTHQSSDSDGESGAVSGGSPVDENPEPVREEVGDTGAEAASGVVDSGAEGAAGNGDEGAADGPASGGGDLLADDGSLGEGDSDEDILDADYVDAEDDRDLLALGPPDEPALEGADVEFPALGEPDPEDFAPDEIVDVAEGVAIFGDNLPMQRLLLIGRITQLAAEYKAALQEGWSVGEFASLQNLIMRIDQGLAPDDEHARARFAALSDASRSISRIDAYAEQQVEYLNGASRAEIDTYNPEEGWP